MFSMEGTFDMHVHAGPDLFGRTGDDLDFAYAAKSIGMAGFAVKAALESTASRAYYVNKIIDGFRMVGGIALNYAVGGINPAAVDACLRQGGRIVWGPSGHSRFHAQIKGGLGNWGHAGMKLYNPPNAEGVTVLDNSGQLTFEAKEVVQLVKEHDAILASSHFSPREIITLAKYCQEEKVKFVFTHLGWTSEYSFELGKEARAYGAIIELCAVTYGGSYTNKLGIEDCVHRIKEYGVENVILCTDAGGLRFPKPYEAFRVFAENLILKGIPDKDVYMMMSTNPLRLINKGA